MIREEDYRDRIFTAGRPGHVSKRLFEMCRAIPGSEVRAIFSSEHLLACHVHWIGAKDSKPCLNHPGCPFCKAKNPRRWKAYAAGIHPQTGRGMLIEITAGAVETCPALMDPARNLRGLVVVLSRRGQSSNSPVAARLEERTGTLLRLPIPQPFDVRAALLKIWNFGANQLARQAGEDEREDFGEEGAPA